MMKNKRKIGQSKEDSAIKFLIENKLTILSKNYRCRYAEIDIIAKDASSIIFIEVKFRAGLNQGHPFEAVSPLKQKRISTAAAHFLMFHKEYSKLQKRFDIISILGEKITWFKSAFEFQGNTLL